jgi:hypothetical protein
MTNTVLRREDGFGGRGDDVYEMILTAHEGLSDRDSAALNARLVLLLANHAGDPAVVEAAIAAARASLTERKSRTE